MAEDVEHDSRGRLEAAGGRLEAAGRGGRRLGRPGAATKRQTRCLADQADKFYSCLLVSCEFQALSGAIVLVLSARRIKAGPGRIIARKTD